jgi:CubicO group peptidase (beta-lactamase class C family)
VVAVVMQMVEEGDIGLDDDINEWLEFPVRNPNHPEDPITLRQLLTHTSSL